MKKIVLIFIICILGGYSYTKIPVTSRLINPEAREKIHNPIIKSRDVPNNYIRLGNKSSQKKRLPGLILPFNNLNKNSTKKSARDEKIFYSISGFIRYNDDNNIPISSGIVKAFKLDRCTGNIIIIDSAFLNNDGSYKLINIPPDSLDIGVFPNSTPPSDWVVTYYPSTMYWQESVILFPNGNLINININAIRSHIVTTSNSVSGKICGTNGSSVINLKGAVIYAVSDYSFIKSAISDDEGLYNIQSLPTGNIKIIASRIGYINDSLSVNLTTNTILDSINFHLRRIQTNINTIGKTSAEEFILYQNYPNPFNPSTKIKFQLYLEGIVKLKIYDIRGKEVSVLVNETLKPGIYEVPFDVDNQLSSGIYFYKLQAESLNDKSKNFINTKKMLFIK
jgi:hypothetical protein